MGCARRRGQGRGGLTLVADEEAHAGPAAVCGEEQAHGVAGADEELWGLGALVLPDERRRAGRPVPHLQGVVVHFGLKPVDTGIRQERNAKPRSLADTPVISSPTDYRPTYSNGGH